ncbi:hypothetical protein IFM89_007741 [Coptis chinensis]|uniref:HAUS augmin-like complex subunit 1 n=1 Tax=Coptis chinensis TaxID=261450 RepID=A0A835IYT0_9MAGN|nr:hypothetical protein IFM89_007741 [Coptis chinensis]
MSDLISTADPSVDEGKSGFDTAHIAQVKTWLASQFEAVGKDVPDFEYTPRSIAHLHALATVSQAKLKQLELLLLIYARRQWNIVHKVIIFVCLVFKCEYMKDGVLCFCLNSASRVREVLENVGLAQESLPQNAVASVQVLANVANLLNIRDTELSSYLVAMGDISLRKTGVEEKRTKVQKECKVLLDYTRKAIARLTYLKRTLSQLEDDVTNCEAQMVHWKTNLAIMLSKERQYLQQYSNYKAILNRVSYTSDISHGVLVEMAEHRKELDKKTKPILDSLRSYQDLPPDKALATLAIEDKRRQYAAAEKYLEEVLHSALATTE